MVPSLVERITNMLANGIKRINTKWGILFLQNIILKRTWVNANTSSLMGREFTLDHLSLRPGPSQ